mmetsp:Transcript_70330/g.217542  ORF Transcript_70330/g.217542 Transcript_70330/m.217542 type:complete len:397 (+) Transcript_70330:82-1272(+)
MAHNPSLSDGSSNVTLLRITLIGSSGSGKSALVNAFVNNVFAYEHHPTSDLELYYSRLHIKADVGDTDFHALVEIEDTWPSNKVSPDKMELLYDPWWPITQKQATSSFGRTHDKKMRSGLKAGGRYAVCACGHGRSDHEGGKGVCKVSPCNCHQMREEGPNVLHPFSGSMPHELWGVPCRRDHTLKFVPDLANTGWLCNGRQDDGGCKNGYTTKAQTKGQPRYRCEACDYELCERCHDTKAKAMTFHNPEPFDVDREGRKYRPLTRNRMAYFFVFDTNDMESYKEALGQEKALRDYMKRKEIKVEPVFFLVGTKVDVDPDTPSFKSVQFSAQSKSIRDSMAYKEVSAPKFQGVRRLFRDAVLALRARQALWQESDPGQGARHGDSELKAPDRCCLQ